MNVFSLSYECDGNRIQATALWPSLINRAEFAMTEIWSNLENKEQVRQEREDREVGGRVVSFNNNVQGN